MKILCVVPEYWPAFRYGGLVFSVHFLNRALVRKGIDVTVYTTDAGLENSVPVEKEVSLEGVKVNYFKFSKLFEFVAGGGWQFSPKMREALKNNLKGFDLVYIVNIWCYPAAIAAHYSRFYKKPYIMVPSGMLYPDTFSKKIWKKWPYYYFMVREYLKAASAIHYTTEDEAEKTHSFLSLRNKAIVVANGVDLSEFTDSFDKESLREKYPEIKDKKIILFLGRIHWIKGLDILIEAYAMIAKDRNDVHLLIVGMDEKGYSRKVKRWIDEYGMNYVDFRAKKDKDYAGDAQVTFTGMLTGQEKLKAYGGSDIFVLPSYSENFGMTVVEAMACGLPVVITNKVGIYKEVERNKAGIVIDTGARSLYQAMKLLLEKPNLRKEIAVNGRKLVEEYYDINNVADKMISVYQEILKA